MLITIVVCVCVVAALSGAVSLWVAADNLVGIHRELRRHNDLCKQAWAAAAERDPYSSRN